MILDDESLFRDNYKPKLSLRFSLKPLEYNNELQTFRDFRDLKTYLNNLLSCIFLIIYKNIIIMNTTNNQQTSININDNKTPKGPNAELYQDYYERKRIAMVMEENNHSRIIAFASLASKGNKDEWLKLGGNSAYFYKYLIAPRLHKKSPTIHPDTDLNYRFKSGIIAIHWKNAFIKNLESLNLKPTTESGLLIFDLHHEFTASEIKKLKAKETEAKNKANQVLKPKTSIPELYQQLLILAQVLPNKIRKTDQYYRTSFGTRINDTVIKLFEEYIKLANGGDKTIIKQNLLTCLNRLNAILIILNENHALDYSSSERLGSLIIDIRNTITRNIK